MPGRDAAVFGAGLGIALLMLRRASAGGGSGGNGDDNGGGGDPQPWFDERLSVESGAKDEFDTALSYNSENFAVVPDAESPHGANHLACAVPTGGHWGGNLYFIASENGYGDVLEVFTTTALKLSEGWQMESGDTCKLTEAGANYSVGDGGAGGVKPDGTNGFSHRIFAEKLQSGDIALGSYVYHMDQPGDYGDEWLWPDPISVGEWHEISAYTRVNTVENGSANADGVVKTWLDGVPQVERTGLRFRTTDSFAIDRIGYGLYYGGSMTSPVENVARYDDLRARFDSGLPEQYR